MNAVSKPTKPPKAIVTNVLADSQGSLSALELQVNIEGQDHKVLLPLSVLDNHGIGDQAVVNELRKIRASVDSVGGAIHDLRGSLYPLVAQQID